jgi:hypothetical protein
MGCKGCARRRAAIKAALSKRRTNRLREASMGIEHERDNVRTAIGGAVGWVRTDRHINLTEKV